MIKTKIKIKTLLLAMCLLAPMLSTWAQITQTAKVVGKDREGRAEFGTSVDIKENFAIVGASRENIAAGALYVYQKNNEGIWNDTQKLTAFDAQEMAEFGGASKFGDDYLVVASGRGDVEGIIRAGSLYIYSYNSNNNTWEFDVKLHARDFSSDAKLGMNPTSLDADGLTIVGGAPGDSGWTGAVYVFEKEAGTWSEKQKLVSPNAQPNETFGIGVSISGSVLAIGANETDNRKGSVYMYEKSSNGVWEYQEQLMASDATSDAFFGSSVSIDQNQLVIGAYGTNGEAGAAYIYQKDSSGAWQEVQKLTGSPTSESAQFGWCTEIKENQVIISAPHAYGFEAGEVYFYKRDAENKWVRENIIQGEDTVGEDFFGWNVALYDDQIISGAPWEDHDATGGEEIDRAGSAYIFKNDFILDTSSVNKEITTSVTVYPNPAFDKILVNMQNTSINKIILYNQLGSELMLKNVSGSDKITFPLSDISAGIYFLKIVDMEGNSTTKKIVKL
ncbi:T9SS type A sorting domain-containing protein [Rasiella sp. SM2506]|uniref:T9SS type A sorting domain-containing protein n=1 Tax=Rasiella sp. SM2506 TaxID=3423914 RepID=UPI003D7B701C